MAENTGINGGGILQETIAGATAEAPLEQQKLETIRFTDSDKHARQLLAQMPNTLNYGPHEFPTLHQYHDIVRHLGATAGALGERRLIALAQRSWHIRGQNGCNFARITAAHAEGLVWEYTVVASETSQLDAALVQAIGATVERAVHDPDTQIHSLLLPGVTNPRQAVAAIGELTDYSTFWLERNEVVDGFLRLYLRYPVNRSNVQAWIMAFGPFDFLPNTRKAPYFELVTRTKPKPPKIFHRLNQDA